MDVVCGRCRAEYEFDDALISERGTTVRCTNCGLQFKVFPPVGRRSPEVWRVFDPANRLAEPLSFESLAQLQRAIAQGEVTAAFRLARGDEEPRALSEIVELQPLLRQPRTDYPAAMPAEPAPLSVPARSRSGTALGMELRPDPAARLSLESPEFSTRAAVPPPRFETEGDDELGEEAVVPGTIDPSDEVIVSRSTRPSSHPKIRSALSLMSNEDVVPPSSGRDGRSSIVPRTSLRSTLSGSFASGPRSERTSQPGPQSVPPTESRSRISQAGDSVFSSAPSAQAFDSALSDAPPAQAVEASPENVPHEDSAVRLDSFIPPELAGAVVAGDSVRQQRPARPSSNPPAPAAFPASTAAATSPLGKIRTPSTPELNEIPESVGGVLSPTPMGMRAYQTVDSQPVSANPRLPSPRRARGASLFVAVLLGGGLFVVMSNREKLGELLGSSNASSEQTESVISGELSARLDDVEIAWMRREFFGRSDTADVTLALVSELKNSGGENSWAMVNLMRAAGDLTQARAIVSKLSKGGDAALARALLDYAESPADPPWPVILDRLREASAGERGKFFARTAYIYALGASGKVRQAKADFDAFSRLSGAKQAPLFGDLEKFVAGLVPEPESVTGGANETQTPHTPTQRDATSKSGPGFSTQASSGKVGEEKPALAHPAQAGGKNEGSESEASAAGELETEGETKFAAKKVSKAVQQKVTQADALWRGGDREGALVLYHQVVSEIGTSHFLGQRSASRIRQAEREKSGAN